MRMINADDLEQALREAGLMEVIKDDGSKCTSAWGVPIIDAEPVVRCKDCERHEYEEAGMVWCPIIVGSWGSEDGYCWLGARREDGRR